MKPSDLEEIRHAMNRLRAKASYGPTIDTRTVFKETDIVMDAISRAERVAAPARAEPSEVAERLWVEGSGHGWWTLPYATLSDFQHNDPIGYSEFMGIVDRIDAAPASAAKPVRVKPVAWQRRIRSGYRDHTDYAGPWEGCGWLEANDMFKREPRYEYRPLYDHPPVTIDT